jgi:hypothetical protein
MHSPSHATHRSDPKPPDDGGTVQDLLKDLLRFKPRPAIPGGPAPSLDPLSGSFRCYVKRDFWELNSIFKQGVARPPGLSKSLAPSTEAGKPWNKITVKNYTVKADAASYPAGFDEREVLGEVCSCVSPKFVARSIRVCRIIAEPMAQDLLRDAVWLLFVVAFQPNDEDVAAQILPKVCQGFQEISLRAKGDTDACDMFAAVLAEAVFQTFFRIFPGSRNMFDDAFCVFSTQFIFLCFYGIVVAPVAVHNLRKTFFPPLWDNTQHAGHGGVTEHFKSASEFAHPIEQRREEALRPRMRHTSEGFFTNTVSSSFENVTKDQSMVYGVGPGKTLRFVPFNSKKAAPRAKIKEKKDEWEIEKPVVVKEKPKVHIPTEDEKNEEVFKECMACAQRHVSMLPQGKAGMRPRELLPSAVRLQKSGEYRRRQTHLPPHLRENPTETRQALHEQRLMDIATEEDEAQWKAFEANLMAGLSRQNS